MIYTFRCPECLKEFPIEIPINEYDKLKNSQRCYYCGGPLKRVIEWTGPATINGGYEAVAGKAKWQ